MSKILVRAKNTGLITVSSGERVSFNSGDEIELEQKDYDRHRWLFDPVKIDEDQPAA